MNTLDSLLKELMVRINLTEEPTYTHLPFQMKSSVNIPTDTIKKLIAVITKMKETLEDIAFESEEFELEEPADFKARRALSICESIVSGT